MIPVFKKMALRITESWIKEHVKLKHDNLDDVKSLSLPGTYNEKISSLGTSLSGFTRLKFLDLSRNALATTEGLENHQTLESLNLYYNNISSLKDLYGLRYLKNLKDLDLRLNPVAKNEPDYRLFIVHMLPNLCRLDDRSVRDSERRAAIMHFTSEQASEFESHLSPNSKIETERLSVVSWHQEEFFWNYLNPDDLTIPLPRSDMIGNLGSRTLALEDDDVAVIDFITQTGGDLTQPRGISGSSARAPDVETFTRDEIYKLYPSSAPLKHKSDTRNITQEKPKPLKDRIYVHFADDDDDFRLSSDPNLKYRDESTAYTTRSTRGYFTPNPRTTNHRTTDHHPSPSKLHSNSSAPLSNDWRYLHDDQFADRDWKSDLTGLQSRGQDSSIPLSARSYELSPSKMQLSPRQSQGHLADKIGTGDGNSSRVISSQDTPLTNPMTLIADESQPSDQGELLKKLLDLVDKYWNGSKSLQRHPKFQSLAKKLLSSYATTGGLGVQISSAHDDGKLDAELAERTAEISRLRDQMSEQQQELEQVRNKLRNQENTKDSLDAASRELVVVQARLKELQEENVSLRSNMVTLEAAKHGATEQERMIGDLQLKNISLQEQVTYLNQQVQQQNVNLQQLQELTNMLQESHRSLVSTNDHLLRELEETRQRHQHEVHQMHWSYDNLKKTIDWIPNSRK